LLAAATRAVAADHGIAVAGIECLGNCKRRLSAGFVKSGAWSYIFGDLAVDSGADLIEGARLFARVTLGRSVGDQSKSEMGSSQAMVSQAGAGSSSA